jgi:hypothetical protein
VTIIAAPARKAARRLNRKREIINPPGEQRSLPATRLSKKKNMSLFGSRAN